VLIQLLHPHLGFLAGEGAHHAPTKRLKATVRRRLRRQASGKDEKEGCTQAIMRPSFKQMGF